MYFLYGQTETDYLARRDKRLADAIARIGPIRREVDADLFSSLVRAIVGQQISAAAQATVWGRFLAAYGQVTPERLSAADAPELQAHGITLRKASYIKNLADSIASGALNVDALYRLPDAEVVATLTRLPGIGVWTAEMILLFCMQRPNILSYGDLGIQRGLRMLYRHRKLDREQFARYVKRFSPYCSVASLYLWAISSGALEGVTDPGRTKPRGLAAASHAPEKRRT